MLLIKKSNPKKEMPSFFIILFEKDLFYDCIIISIYLKLKDLGEIFTNK